MKNKKLKIYAIIFISFFILSIANLASAAEICTWTKASVSSQKDGDLEYCPNNLTQTTVYSKCAGTMTVGQLCCCRTITETTGTASTDTTKDPLFTMPDFQVQIPGLNKLATITCPASGQCSIPWLGQYIAGIYNYALAIAGILAALVLMGGGLIWLVSGGDASRITQAKELIIGSITGLVILSASYIILLQVNPNLVNLKSISVSHIETIVLDTESTEPLPLDTVSMSNTLGVICGVDSVNTIVQKSKGKVTYNNVNRGKSGPNGTIYNDCSGFAGFVLKCASNKTSDANTSSIFQTQQAWDKNLNSLVPGDLVGWAPQNSKSGEGHAVIYLGNGVFGDCHGGTAGRAPGGCVSSSMSLQSILDSATKYSYGDLYFRRY